MDVVVAEGLEHHADHHRQRQHGGRGDQPAFAIQPLLGLCRLLLLRLRARRRQAQNIAGAIQPLGQRSRRERTGEGGHGGLLQRQVHVHAEHAGRFRQGLLHPRRAIGAVHAFHREHALLGFHFEARFRHGVRERERSGGALVHRHGHAACSHIRRGLPHARRPRQRGFQSGGAGGVAQALDGQVKFQHGAHTAGSPVRCWRRAPPSPTTRAAGSANTGRTIPRCAPAAPDRFRLGLSAAPPAPTPPDRRAGGHREPP